MTLQELKSLARTRGVMVRNMRRENIIRTIQRAEGNNDCFATGQIYDCRQSNCLWHDDCSKYALPSEELDRRKAVLHLRHACSTG